ncbi:TetR/AcrR family transcriptional regulator [Methylomonas sp. UP202]|uniref:TetR/AcrR family transcriptional regulator n=1 Tax=Methylomonas sp. UP202 TaxID=3040943 RepID=UPI002478B0C7|nr:TetR/AcrR family transcriptional regulator [Methylomonas sp. UP202]WGS86652.1 TetR/AcrR family transcriptional regulator [Methylomonas sp. UP202]
MAKNLQQRLLDAATELFYSQGIKATGIDAIVKLAGTNKMTLYNYFSSKDELVLAFLRKRDEDFTHWFVEQLNNKAEHPKDKILAIFDVIEDWMSVPSFRGCAFINAAAEFPVEGNPVHQLSAEFYDKFSAFISSLAAACGIVGHDSLATQITLLVEGAIVSEQMKRHAGASRQAKRVAEILIATYQQASAIPAAANHHQTRTNE